MRFNSAIQKALESQYTGLVDIYEFQKVKDPTTKKTETKEVKVYEQIPCKLVHEEFPRATDGIVDEVYKIAVLLISPSYTVKAGSKAVVTQYDVTETYENAGQPAVYRHHQEITFHIEDDKA